MNVSYILGFVLGIAGGILLVYLSGKLIKKFGGKCEIIGKKDKDIYDERQLFVRRKASNTGYMILIIYVFLVGMADDMFKWHVLMSFAGLMLGVFISLGVYIILCIAGDAYIALSENKKGRIMVIAVAAIVNIFPAYAAIKDGRDLIEDGRLGIRCMNIICMVLIVAIIIAFAIKDICDKKLKDSDEE